MPKLLSGLEEDYTRPWGGYTRYTNNQQSTVKILTVKAGEEISYQYHRQRDEIWIPLDPGLKVNLDDQLRPVTVNEIIEIKRGTKHQVINDTDHSIRWLEISLGQFDENDNIRLRDKYGRT